MAICAGLGALLLVYPGFFQQSISTAYESPFHGLSSCSALSIYLMVLAVKQSAQGLVSLSAFMDHGLRSDLYD